MKSGSYWPLVCAFCCGCCVLLLWIAAWGKGTLAHQSAFPVPRSMPRASIGSATLDREMTLEEEAAILKQINSIDNSSWLGFSVQDLAAHLSNEKLPVFLNKAELEGYGVALKTPVGPSDVQDRPLLVRLSMALEPLELTYQIRAGFLEITSVDAAAANPQLRVYDVSCIMTDQAGLENTIYNHVDPNSWICNGGCNSITFSRTPSQVLMFVSAPTARQLELKHLLDVVNCGERIRLEHFWGVQPAGQNVSSGVTANALGGIARSTPTAGGFHCGLPADLYE